MSRFLTRLTIIVIKAARTPRRHVKFNKKSRAQIYAARMSRGNSSSSYRLISAARARPPSAANPPAAAAAVDRRDRQTDGHSTVL